MEVGSDLVPEVVREAEANHGAGVIGGSDDQDHHDLRAVVATENSPHAVLTLLCVSRSFWLVLSVVWVVVVRLVYVVGAALCGVMVAVRVR
jgi:hypothetical protein